MFANISLASLITQENKQCLEGIKFISMNLLLPVIIAVVAYIIIHKFEDWKQRKTQSKLGIAIIESLQEEIQKGIEIMQNTLRIARDPTSNSPPQALLPTGSWNGMLTIPNYVLIRIITTSEGEDFTGFPLRECRIHSKNYFEHMCRNYKETLDQSMVLFKERQNWRILFIVLLADDQSQYIKSALGVKQMLEETKKLLEKNSKAIFPK